MTDDPACSSEGGRITIEDGGDQDRVAPEPAVGIWGDYGVDAPPSAPPQEPVEGLMIEANGYVRLHRKVVNNPIWTQLSPAVYKVFTYFILQANWKPSKWFDGEHQITIPRGSFITSYPTVQRDCNLTRKQVRDAFADLEKLKIGALTRAPKWTMVTVLNYDTYNPPIDDQGTQQGTIGATSGPHRGPIRAPAKEGKKERREEELQNPSPSPMGVPANGSSHKAQVDALFAEFWPHVWRKVGKEDSRKAFPRALKYICAQRQIKAPAAVEYLISLADKEPENAMVPGNESRSALHPATWLNGHRWEDEITEAALPHTTGTRKGTWTEIEEKYEREAQGKNHAH